MAPPPTAFAARAIEMTTVQPIDGRRAFVRNVWIVVVGALGISPSEAFELSLPIDCVPGRTCAVQNYVDVDTRPGHYDYRCGPATYNGHKGTDFRIPAAAASRESVAVLAAAPGIVTAARDGVADRFIRSPADRRRIAGQECGNGVVIDHGNGWQTQYCHMRRGSIQAKPGQVLNQGDTIGRVGKSGASEFYHVHLTVRRNGKVVDPFLGPTRANTCRSESGMPPGTLWKQELHAALSYRGTSIFQSGFTERGVTSRDLDRGALRPPDEKSPAVVFYAHLLHTLPGDQIRLTVRGPAGFFATNTTKPINRAKAQYVAYVGKRRKGQTWLAGRYIGEVTLLRKGKAIRRAGQAIDIAGN